MSKTFCVLPWIHLATHPHGGVTLCCQSDHTAGRNRARNHRFGGPDEFLTLSEHGIDNMMNSDYFREVRLQMLAGEAPAACTRCYDEEARGMISKRVLEAGNFPGFDFSTAQAITQPDGSIPRSLRFVELRLGNICNVKCRSCNPASSSKWVTEYAKLEGEFPWLQTYQGLKGFDWPERQEFWDDLRLHANQIELIYINGGEPTLIRKHWEFLADLRARGHAQNITLWYSINMTNLPEEAFEIWRAFKAVRVSCSIDDLGERNTYLRHGTKWADVDTNLTRLLAQPWINTSITQTVSFLNLPYLGEFYSEMSRRGVYVEFNFVNDPAFLAAWNIPEDRKADVLARLARDIPPERLAYVEANLMKKADPIALQRGLNYNVSLDRMRREDGRNVFPLFYELVDR